MKFKKEDLETLALGLDVRGFRVEDHKLDDANSMFWYYTLVFKFEGKYYRSLYKIGTEQSGGVGAYYHEPDEIECQEVFPETIEVIKWVPVPNLSK